MNFLSFRDQIYDWTLDTDQNLFNQVNQLTDYIFQTQQNINQSIAITRSALNQSSTILNNNYNHYLRLSENKFTQNKIAEPKKASDQNDLKQQTTVEPKSKMQIFKEALNISLKNLQIKQQDKQADNVSISELSLSQAIFKNARLPPYFGSKEFRAQKFLNLFFDEDLGSQIISKKQIQSLSNQPLSTPSQNIRNQNQNNTTTSNSNGYLPPPPSLESLNLGLSNNMNSQQGILPPPLPPTLTIPSPPSLSAPLIPPPPPIIPEIVPIRQSLIIDQQDENKKLLESILVSTKAIHNNGDSQIDQSNQYQSDNVSAVQVEESKPVENKPLTFQQELALKLKYGKDYKPPIKVIQTKKQPVLIQKIQSQENLERSNSFRQSTKIQYIIGSASSVNIKKSQSKQQSSSFFGDQDEQEQNALFGSGKRKTVSQIESTQTSKIAPIKNDADIMMSRSTFNQDMLFKKKPIFSKEIVMPTKLQQKIQQKQEKRPNRASVLFNQDSDQEQENFTFKKKTTKKPQQKQPQQQSPKKKSQEKKSNPLGLSQKQQIKDKIIQQPKKKNINKLFGGQSDQEQDIFAKKKVLTKKQSDSSTKVSQIATKKSQAPVSVIQKPIQKKIEHPKATKKNSLFNDEQQEQDVQFKPKSKPVKTENKKQNQEKKSSSLFGNDDDEQDFTFRSKPKITKKENQKLNKQEQTIKVKAQSLQKQKNPLLSAIAEQQIQEKAQTSDTKRQTQKIQKIQKPIQPTQQQLQQAKKLKKIARMGGQAMMGMAQLLPKGMQITKPSQTKNNQKLAREILQHEQNKPIITQEVHKQIVQYDLKKKQQQIQKQIEKEQKIQKLQNNIQIKVDKLQQKKESQTKEVIQSNTSSQFTLQVRRKKNKPKRTEDLFEENDEINNKIENKTVQTTPQVVQKKQHKIQPIKQQKKNPLMFGNPKESDEKATKIQKIAKMSMVGMPQMGLGPLIPKGLIITKPSQAKKLQQQALDRAKEQELQELKNKEEEQKEKEKNRLKQIQEQELRMKTQKYQQQKMLLEQQKKRIEEQQRKQHEQFLIEQKEKQRIAQQARKKQIEQIQKQKLIQIQNEKKRLQLQKQKQERQQLQKERKQKEQRQRQNLEQLQRKRQQAQKQRQEQQQLEKKRKQQEQKQRKRIKFQEEEKQRQKLIDIQNQRLRLKNLEQIQKQKKHNEQEQRRKQQQQLKKQKSNLPSLPSFDLGNKKSSNPLGGNPLGGKSKNSGPLDVPKLPPKTNPLGGVSKAPLGGVLSNTPKPTGLQSNTSNTLPPMPIINKQAPKNTGKKSLFDDEQQDVSFTKKKQVNIPKPSISNNQKKKPSLFGDDQQDAGFSFSSKTKQKKNTTSKKSLFDDDDDEGFGFGKKSKKSQAKEPIIQTPIIETKPQQIKNVSQKSNLFNNDSDEENLTIGKKKPQTKDSQKLSFGSNKIQQQIKNIIIPPQKIIQKPNNKKGLFDNSDEEDNNFGKKKVQKKQVQNTSLTTNNLPQKQRKPQKQIKTKKGLFGSSDEEQIPKKSSKPTVNKQSKQIFKQSKPKKGLFGVSDDEDEDPFAKKVQKKIEPTKSGNNIMQSQPLISTKPTQSVSSSSLIPPKKSESLSPSPISATSKPVNPLESLSNNLNQAKSQPISQPATQQKKRNIFEQSDQQDSSPIIASRPNKVSQKPQKKGIISEESQEQIPIKKQQTIKVVPVKEQQQVTPPVQTNNNRRLFDDSEEDSDQEQMIKKKRMANNKLKKLF